MSRSGRWFAAATCVALALAVACGPPSGPGAAGPGAQDPGAQDPGAQDPGAQDPGAQDPGAQDPGATGRGDGARVELIVYAATSTRDVLQALAATYERAHAVDLVFNFGSSGDLSRQIVAAAQADVFLSADERELDRVQAAGLVAAGSRRTLLSNQLVVVEPTDVPSRFSAPFTPQQLTDARIARLSLANVDTVPAGRYARAWLQEVGVWGAVAGRVLPGIDVRAALAAVESAAADAGIVYRTDAARSTRARVVFAVPVAEGPAIAYPIAAIAGRPNAARAGEYIEFLGGSAARAVFQEHGFVALDRGAGSSN